jgi:intracellular multiplication protein IcmV
MAIKDVFKVSRKTFFNPSAWLGYTELKAHTRFLWQNLKLTFTIAKPQRIETFEEALIRQNIIEADLQVTAKRYRLYSLIFVALASGALLASFYYLFYYDSWQRWCLAFVVSLLLGANAFKYDFWLFQIKQRKLGCTFDDWWHNKPANTKGTKT